jgi:hypothetical protein
VRVEVEHGVLGQLAVAVDERGRVAEQTERPPDGLMNAERVRVLYERGEEELEGFLRLPAGGEVSRQRQPGTPVLRRVSMRTGIAG